MIMRTKYLRKRQETGHVYTYYFERPADFRYIAGQFIELRLPHEDCDDRGDKRWFTLSSAPSEKELSITTRHSNDDYTSTFKTRLRELKPTEEIELSFPMGDFVLPVDKSMPLLFISVGLGSTPFRSILADLRLNDEERNIEVIYIPSVDKEYIFEQEFKNLKERFQRLDLDWRRLVAYRGTDTAIWREISELAMPFVGRRTYISGPEEVVEKLQAKLMIIGWDKQEILTDFFHGYVPDTIPN